ncbi:MAG: hypothetical protein ACTHNU_18035 [Gaiellales bacterium]
MASAIVMVFLTVPAEARSQTMRALDSDNAIAGFPGAIATTAASFVESERTQLEEADLIMVTARVERSSSPSLAGDFWRAVESTLFRGGVSAVEHMVAYAVPEG